MNEMSCRLSVDAQPWVQRETTANVHPGHGRGVNETQNFAPQAPSTSGAEVLPNGIVRHSAITASHHKQNTKNVKLFVGQLPFECTEQQIFNLFSVYGMVENLHILRDQNGRSSGAALVTYRNTQEADTAIFTLHNRYYMIPKKPIQVSYAKISPSISEFGTLKALEVHNSNRSNPMPDVVKPPKMELAF